MWQARTWAGTFLVVATPQHDALREAAYFVDRLTEEGMPLSGMVLNRVHTSALAISPERALSLAEDLAGLLEVGLGLHRQDEHHVGQIDRLAPA